MKEFVNKYRNWIIAIIVILGIMVIRECTNKQVIGYYQSKVQDQKEMIQQQQKQIDQLTESCDNWYQLVEDLKNDSIE